MKKKTKTKRKAKHQPAKRVKTNTKAKLNACSINTILGEKYFTYNGNRYVITTAEEITEGHNFTDYDGSKSFLPTFKKVYLQGVRKMDKKEYL